MSHFKNVLHRAMWTRGHDPLDQSCRVCKHAYENIEHLALCQGIWPIFEAFARLASADVLVMSATERKRFALFALLPDGKQLEPGWINLHLLLWKHIIYALTVVSTEDATFEQHSIWQAAWARFERKAHAKQENTRTLLLRAESRGSNSPDIKSKARPLAPIASFEEDAKLVWDNNIVALISKLATPPPKKKKR